MPKPDPSDLEFNGGQKKPNGCETVAAFEYCYANDYIIKLTRCNHPDRKDTINFATHNPCRPCHPRAVHRHDDQWTFGN